MAQDETLVPAAEFQALPLAFIVAAPLKAAVDAQAVAAKTTSEFIDSLMTNDGADRKPVSVDFSATLNQSAGVDGSTASVKTVNVSAPLLSMVPIPHLRIDSITTHFKYEISSVQKESSESSKKGSVKIGSGKLLSPWVSASITGSVSSNSSSDSVMNRSGVLEITVNASEAPIPEGLAKILGILTSAISVTPAPQKP